MNDVLDLIGHIKEKLFHLSDKGKVDTGDRDRLRSLHTHLEERDKHPHGDFIETHQPYGDHQCRVEHHANRFWHYYYPGERPKEVLDNDPVKGQKFWTDEQFRAMRDKMLVPKAEDFFEIGPGNYHQNASHQHWVYSLTIGDMAMDKGGFEEAEISYRAALHEAEHFNVTDTRLLRTLKRLARALAAQGKYTEFETVFERALSLDVELPEPMGAYIDDELNHFALQYLKEGDLERAEKLYIHILSVLERLRGPDALVVSRCLNDLAGVYGRMERWDKAETVLKRALYILEHAPTQQSCEMAATLHNLGAIYAHQKRNDEAQELYGRALALLEKHDGTGAQEWLEDNELLDLSLDSKKRKKKKRAKVKFL